MEEPLDHPEVIVFPPLLIGLTLLLTIALHQLWPLSISFRPLALGLGAVLAVLGLASAGWGRQSMIQGGTNVSPFKPSTALVAAGPFRFTRNPLYVGITSLFIGMSLLIGTGWGLILIIPASLLLHYGVVLREERYLEEKFGESYLTYKSAVRRYL